MFHAGRASKATQQRLCAEHHIVYSLASICLCKHQFTFVSTRGRQSAAQ